MKKSLIVLIAAILIGISIVTVNTYNSSNKGSTTEKNNTSTKPIGIKTKAIDFKLKDLYGKELSLSDLKGKKVFLNFWATWFPPCKAEMPEIEKLYQETKDSDLVIVAVDMGEPLSTVKSFIDKNKYTFKVLLDSDQSVASKYNIASIPTSFFIDADGTIVSKHVGQMDIDKMRASIKALDK